MKLKMTILSAFIAVVSYAQEPDSLQRDLNQKMDSLNILLEQEEMEYQKERMDSFDWATHQARMDSIMEDVNRKLQQAEEKLERAMEQMEKMEKSLPDSLKDKNASSVKISIGSKEYEIKEYTPKEYIPKELNNETEENDDKAKTSTKGNKFKKHQLTWWTGIDLGVNGILSGNHDFKLSGSTDFLEPDYDRSRYIAFNFGEAKARIIKDCAGFTTGLSFQIYNYKYGYRNEFSFSRDSMFYTPVEGKALTKNKLRVSYLAVPALLEFNTSTKPSKSFHITAGVVGKIRIGNMYKQKYIYEGRQHKSKTKTDLGFNRWAADATVRMGYGNFTVFAQTGLLPLFKKDNVSDVYNFSAGIFIKI